MPADEYNKFVNILSGFWAASTAPKECFMRQAEEEEEEEEEEENPQAPRLSAY
jgi:hypothetical protein